MEVKLTLGFRCVSVNTRSLCSLSKTAIRQGKMKNWYGVGLLIFDLPPFVTCLRSICAFISRVSALSWSSFVYFNFVLSSLDFS